MILQRRTRIIREDGSKLEIEGQGTGKGGLSKGKEEVAGRDEGKEGGSAPPAHCLSYCHHLEPLHVSLHTQALS